MKLFIVFLESSTHYRIKQRLPLLTQFNNIALRNLPSPVGQMKRQGCGEDPGGMRIKLIGVETVKQAVTTSLPEIFLAASHATVRRVPGEHVPVLT